MKQAVHRKANLFSSIFMMNENGKLRISKLPVEAQLSVINAVVVQDFDGDGIKDILLAGNKFDVEVETTPADGSPGLLMKGLGNMKFRCLRSGESGFFVPYNVKDMQAIQSPYGWSIIVSSNNDKLRTFGVRTSLPKTVALK